MSSTLALDHGAAALTAVADCFRIHGCDFFKIPSTYPVHFKTFRAVTASQLIFANGKVTVPAAQPVAFHRYQGQDFMFAGRHSFLSQNVSRVL
jgi:hypothetical protein